MQQRAWPTRCKMLSNKKTNDKEMNNREDFFKRPKNQGSQKMITYGKEKTVRKRKKGKKEQKEKITNHKGLEVTGLFNTNQFCEMF